jgi:hypothetical protein
MLGPIVLPSEGRSGFFVGDDRVWGTIVPLEKSYYFRYNQAKLKQRRSWLNGMENNL